MARGDHIYVQYLGFTHHALDLGDGYVAEYGGKGSARMTVRLTRAHDFWSRGTVYAIDYPAGSSLSIEEAVANAMSRVGEQRYNLLTNNCEHFVYWCKTGNSWSPQVENWLAALKEVTRIVANAYEAAYRPKAQPDILGSPTSIVRTASVDASVSSRSSLQSQPSPKRQRRRPQRHK